MLCNYWQFSIKHNCEIISSLETEKNSFKKKKETLASTFSENNCACSILFTVPLTLYELYSGRMNNNFLYASFKINEFKILNYVYVLIIIQKQLDCYLIIFIQQDLQ